MNSIERSNRVEGRVSSEGGALNGHERQFLSVVGWRTVPSPSPHPSPYGRGRTPAAFDTLRATLDTRRSTLGSRLAFTLIELLVVIAIMSVLAALIIPITGAVTRHKLRSRTRAELRSIETAIEDYKTKRGYYPPDNPGSQYYLNQLYYELSGTVFSSGVYTTLDGSGVLNPPVNPPIWYGQGFNGIVNTTKGAGDEGMAAQEYIRELKPSQVAEMNTMDNTKVKVLVGSVGWDSNVPLIPTFPA